MRFEYWILLAVYIVTAAIIFFILKHKIRLAVVAFLFTQVITFLLGLAAVQFGLLQYPIRLFPSTNRASFTYEYFAFPVVCALFYVTYPNDKSKFVQLAYYIGFSSVLTIGEVLLEKYTQLINYVHWEWYITWVTVCLTFFVVRLFTNWFFS